MHHNIQLSVHELLHNPKYLLILHIQEPNLGFIVSIQVPNFLHKHPMHLTHVINEFTLNMHYYPHVQFSIVFYS